LEAWDKKFGMWRGGWGPRTLPKLDFKEAIKVLWPKLRFLADKSVQNYIQYIAVAVNIIGPLWIMFT
jgi:hypothetical protein